MNKKYNVSFFQDTKSGAKNVKTLFDDYDKAVQYAHKLSRCSNIKSVYLETLLISHIDTSVIKD